MCKCHLTYFVFGSENSQDWDIAIKVGYVGSPEISHDIIKKHSEYLKEFHRDKVINANLITYKDGKILTCFKGTPDELNNSIYYTYKNHKQQSHINPIESPVNRDINLKINRVARFLITFFSRTHLRTDIKSALRGNMKQKLEVLKQIDYSIMTEFPKKKEKKEDIYKVTAFQFGQVFSLLDGHEPDSYTKNDIIKNYPQFETILNRGELMSYDKEILNQSMKRFISILEEKIKNGYNPTTE